MPHKEQIESTICMLALAAAQIEATMLESGDSVSALSESFSAIAEKFHHLDGHKDNTVISLDMADFQSLRVKINEAIIAMQFYDRMTQRLHHINEGLTATSSLLENPTKTNESNWSNLQKNIKNHYTMESERTMFEQIIAGSSLNEALTTFRQAASNPSNNVAEDDIELF
jgi:hypothetical protein